jgi:hypothetical protein
MLIMDSVAIGNFEENGLFFTADCSRVNNVAELVTWNFNGLFLLPTIIGIVDSFLGEGHFFGYPYLFWGIRIM